MGRWNFLAPSKHPLWCSGLRISAIKVLMQQGLLTGTKREMGRQADQKPQHLSVLGKYARFSLKSFPPLLPNVILYSLSSFLVFKCNFTPLFPLDTLDKYTLASLCNLTKQKVVMCAWIGYTGTASPLTTWWDNNVSIFNTQIQIL